MSEGRYLSPRLLQAVGLAMLIGSFVFWGLTGQQSALLVGASLSLIGLGAYGQLHISIKQEFAAEKKDADRNGA